jgi:hypothetical protein
MHPPSLSSQEKCTFEIAKGGKLSGVNNLVCAVLPGVYQWLGTKEREKDIYRMVKSGERKTIDITRVKYIKDVTERLLTKDEDNKNR